MPLPSVFFAHRTVDNGRVEELKKELDQLLPDLGYEDLSETVPDADNWKDVAGPLIQRADAFICVVGSETHSSEPVSWEVEQACSVGCETLIVLLDEQYELPAVIKERNLKYKVWNARNIASDLGDILIRKALFNCKKPQQNLHLVFSQYAIMVESWETLINRRQSVNQLYLGAVAALIAATAGLVGFAKELGASNMAAAVLIIAFLGLMLAWNWLQTLQSYGTLSQAKSKIVGAMEAVLPARLFDAEWKVLQRKLYKSTTETDKRTVVVVLAIFFLIFLVAAVCLIRALGG